MEGSTNTNKLCKFSDTISRIFNKLSEMLAQVDSKSQNMRVDMRKIQKFQK